VSEVRTDQLASRYGGQSPRRRRGVIIASGVVGVLALAWLAWAGWSQSTPEVQSNLQSFEVLDSHSVAATVVVDTSAKDVTANCLVRAVGTDHSVVGELNFEVNGHDGASRHDVSLRTERRATSVELIGCTTANQSRPR
jgi:type II secretory pathway component PulM